MPTYLCHGFRWHRPGIRTFAIIQNLEDVSPDWIARPGTTRALIDAFYRLFPFLPEHDVETDAEAEVAAALAAQKEAAQKAIVTAAAAEERGRKQAEAAALATRSKSRSRKDKKVKEGEGNDTKEDVTAAADIPPIIPNTPGANAYLAALAAMRANIEATPPGKIPMPVISANVYVPEQPGVPPDGVVRRSNGRDDLLALQEKSCIKLLEEHDADRQGEWTRPHAYVADYATRIDLSVSIVDEMARYERLQHQRWRREAKTKDGHPSMAGPADEGVSFATLGGSLSGGTSDGGRANTLTKKKKTAGWFEMVRDQLQRGEEIRWYIVVNNDETRSFGDEPVADDEPAVEAEEEDGTPSVLTRNQDAERERELRRLRTELAGDPDILVDDLPDDDDVSDDDDDDNNNIDENDDDNDKDNESRPGTAVGTAIGNAVTPSTSTSSNTITTSNAYSTTPLAGRPRGNTTTSAATTTTAFDNSNNNNKNSNNNEPMVFPLPPQQQDIETRRPHTSSAPHGPISDSFLSDFPSPPQLVLSSPSRQLPQRQSQTPNFSTPSPLPALLPIMPPIPASPPPQSSPPPPLRNRKSLGAGGFRRLFGRSKHQHDD